MSAHRDPRLDPEPGDVVVVHGKRFTVLEVDRETGSVVYVGAHGVAVQRPLGMWRTAAFGGLPIIGSDND